MLLMSSCALNTESVSQEYSEGKNIYTKKAGEYSFTLSPYSSETLAAINYPVNSVPEATRDSIIKDYDNFVCFVMEIRVNGFTGDIIDYEAAGRQNEHDKKQNYYLFGMQNDLNLKGANGVEIPCAIYYYERMNTITGNNRFIVGFKKSNVDYEAFEYCNPYLNCGKITFSINKQLLALTKSN